MAAASIGCLAAGLLYPGVAAADRPDPIGLPKPYTGPPLVQGTHGPSPWVQLVHQPPFSPGSMLLMSNGNVLVHDDDSRQWEELVPSRNGSYAWGHWHRIASLPAGYAPEYFASAVLRDGRVIILGGEYDGGSQQAETNRGAVYGPVSNAWKPVHAPPGWTQIGDAQSTLLDDGRLMLADVSGSDDALLNPRTLTWSSTGAGKDDPNTEEGFSLLRDGRVLTVDSFNRGSELFDPSSGRWSSAGTVPTTLVDTDQEQGPLVSGPNGTVFAAGATGHTAIYHSVAGHRGTWSVGPRFPNLQGQQLVAADAAGARLPNGDVLLDASPDNYQAPTHFFIFNGHGLRLLDDNGTASTSSAYDTRMLVLPNGQVLYDDDQEVYVFRSAGSPHASWRPTIGAVPSRLVRGRTYSLHGTQLAGRDQGAAYGDDFQDNTNYPLMRIVDLRWKTVTYARTLNWSSVSTAPGARSSTQFILPHDTPLGASALVVVANGIASKPVTVDVTRSGGSFTG